MLKSDSDAEKPEVEKKKEEKSIKHVIKKSLKVAIYGERTTGRRKRGKVKEDMRNEE